MTDDEPVGDDFWSDEQESAMHRLLAAWLPGQRWFSGRGREIATVATTRHPLSAGDPAVWLLVVSVSYADGGSEIYSVPVSVRSSTTDALSYAVIGDVGSGLWLHDALHDRDTTRIWSSSLISAARYPGVEFTLVGDASAIEGMAGDALTVEQSNTSLVFGESAITKFFRRLEPGKNPDVQVHEALAPTGNPHLAALLGYTTVDLPAGQRATAAMTQAFLPVASDGWALATASVRDLYAEGDLRADEVGGDFAGESRRLGAATASVHTDLARMLPSAVGGSDWYRTQATIMQRRLEGAVHAVPALAEHADGLRRCYTVLAGLTEPVRLQRVHGDLHLGQVLRTATGWTILDFEGEPLRSFSERFELSSPLRDVAGMLRSFEYAARSLLLDGREEPQLAYRAREWATRNREAFLTGYAEQADDQLPADGILLRALEADKAVYEAVYEARHRPDWLSVPLRSLERITSEETR